MWSRYGVMTTLPWGSPSMRWRMASEVSLRGYVLSRTGVIFPASRKSRKTAIVSFLLGIEKFGLGSCFTKRERNISLTKWGMSPSVRLPDSPNFSCPMRMYSPSGLSARPHRRRRH